MLDDKKVLSSDSIDGILNNLSKNIKKTLGRQANVEIVIVGGGSILLNYGFRESTTDLNVFVRGRQSIKEAIHRTADEVGLPADWMNTDFSQTSSYSPKLLQYSRFYRTFNQVLSVRTIADEYLIAMKLASFREYKCDKSDIVGILQARHDNPITLERIEKAVIDLYGSIDYISNEAYEYVREVISAKLSAAFYKDVRNEELSNKQLLQEFEEEYQDVLTEDNLSEILTKLQESQDEIVL